MVLPQFNCIPLVLTLKILLVLISVIVLLLLLLFGRVSDLSDDVD